jgi:hypothetical protein
MIPEIGHMLGFLGLFGYPFSFPAIFSSQWASTPRGTILALSAWIWANLVKTAQ